LIWVVG